VIITGVKTRKDMEQKKGLTPEDKSEFKKFLFIELFIYDNELKAICFFDKWFIYNYKIYRV